MKNNARKGLTLGLAIAVAGSVYLADNAFARRTVNAVNIQSNPVFSTPIPAPQKLGPTPKPFEGEAVELDTTVDKATLQDTGLDIDDVEFQGNEYYNKFTVERMSKGLLEKLEGDEPVKLSTLKSEIARINKYNNFKLKATVKKSDVDGKPLLHLDVYEQQPFQLAGTFDNQGRPGIGTLRGGAQFVDDSLLGFGDRLTVTYVGATRSNRIEANYAVPLNHRGGLFSFTYAYHNVDYGPTDETNTDGARYEWDRDFIGRDHVWIATLEQPLDKDRVWTPYISGLIRNVVVRRGDRAFTPGDPRPLTVGLRYNKPDKNGQTTIDAASIVGQQWLGGDSKFWRVRLAGNRVQNLPHQQKLIFRAATQLSGDALPPVQQFPIGGAYSVRGYTEGLLLGDRGHWYSLEHHWPVPYLNKVSPYAADRVRGVTFFDFGQTWLDQSNTRYRHGISHKRNHTLLMAAGVGFRARLTQYAQGFCDFGWGMGKRNEVELNANPAFRVHFGVRSELLPKKFATNDKKDVWKP